MQKMIAAEVRLYFAGREDFDVEHFEATCPTDIMNKAMQIAESHRADHFNFGIATTEDEYKHSGPVRRPKVVGVSANPRDQIAAIQKVMGIEEA